MRMTEDPSVGFKRARLESSPVAMEAEEEPPASTFRRGARASYYRKPTAPSQEVLPVPEAENNPEQEQPRTPHEQLLDACEEGDLEAVKRNLERPDADTYVNLQAFARGVRRKEFPEVFAWGRGDTALRYAAFHGYHAIVQALLDAGAVPGLRNDEAKHALGLLEAGTHILGKKRTDPRHLPRGDSAERADVAKLLEVAMAQQWIVKNGPIGADLDGRIAQVVGVGQDGRRLAIIRDAEPSSRRPYYQAEAVRSVYLKPRQLCRAPRPPPSATAWPLDARFTCALAGKPTCDCSASAGEAQEPGQGAALEEALVLPTGSANAVDAVSS